MKAKVILALLPALLLGAWATANPAQAASPSWWIAFQNQKRNAYARTKAQIGVFDVNIRRAELDLARRYAPITHQRYLANVQYRWNLAKAYYTWVYRQLNTLKAQHPRYSRSLERMKGQVRTAYNHSLAKHRTMYRKRFTTTTRTPTRRATQHGRVTMPRMGTTSWGR